MEALHVTASVTVSPRALRPLATALRAVRGVQAARPRFRLAGAAADEQAATARMVLFHVLPVLLLATGPEVRRHG